MIETRMVTMTTAQKYAMQFGRLAPRISEARKAWKRTERTDDKAKLDALEKKLDALYDKMDDEFQRQGGSYVQSDEDDAGAVFGHGWTILKFADGSMLHREGRVAAQAEWDAILEQENRRICPTAQKFGAVVRPNGAHPDAKGYRGSRAESKS